MKYSLFIFRRDLRITDNLGLLYAMENYQNIIPIFIFTPEQVTSKNSFKSNNAIQFMIESLQSLDTNLKNHSSRLHLFYGENIKVLGAICKEIEVENIIYNMDYTPYARKRDESIMEFGKKNGINVIVKEDYLLAPIGTFLKADGLPYTVFTPFRNNGIKMDIEKPSKKQAKNLTKKKISSEHGYIDYEVNDFIAVKGGREEGLKMLQKVSNQGNYNEDRNSLIIPTTMLSAYIKFGNISIRETYWKIRDLLGMENDLVSQLFWREFYFYIAYYFPRVLEGANYNPRYDKIKWAHNKEYFERWMTGTTGFPVVDAGMREMNQTGYMHNRARLITANFMNRMLGLDWREGEKYYATQLTDYDPAVNNGNWQWIASTGVDPKPYFQRLFNPWLQSKKFDVNCEYIKKWIPSLKDIPNKELHEWEKYCSKYDLKEIDYVAPVVNYKQAREKSVAMYRKV